MGQLAQFQADQNEALEDVVVENEIQVEVLVIDTDTLLPANKRKALAQLQKEGLQIVDQAAL